MSRIPSSPYYGVTKVKGKEKWIACIVFEGKTRYIGIFSNEEDAYKAVEYTKATGDFTKYRNPRDNPTTEHKHIVFVRNRYRVSKQFDKKSYYIGSYKYLETALKVEHECDSIDKIPLYRYIKED